MDILSIIGDVIFFLLAFLFIFLVDFFFICRKRNKSTRKKEFRITSEGLYLIGRFNLDEKKINIKKMDFHIAIINSFIIAFVSTTISLIGNNIILELGIGFVLLFLLIYSIYEIYGRHIRKEWSK